jgi:membrane protease YdiL (CAAX protease family)
MIAAGPLGAPAAAPVAPGWRLADSQKHKVAAVAVAAFLFSSLQFRCTWTVASVCALGASGTTFLAEALIDRPHQEEWFSSRGIYRESIYPIVKILAFRVALIGGMVFFGLVFPQSAVQRLQVLPLFSSSWLYLSLLISVVAPYTEEVLFRGFLQERVDDCLLLIRRHRIELPYQWVFLLSNLPSLLFGAIHLIGNQVVDVDVKLVIFLFTASMGMAVHDMKQETGGSLLLPFCFHSAVNASVPLGVTLGKVARGCAELAVKS